MQIIERTFFERCRRYFAPLFDTKRVTFKALVLYMLWGIAPIVHIVFIQLLVTQFESGTQERFFELTVYYLIYNISYEILDFSIRKWGWVENINEYRKVIDSEYIRKFVKTSNTEVEKTGTGKLVSIVTNGSDTWALSLDLFLLEASRILYVFIFSAYMFFNVSAVYGLAFLGVYIIVLSIGSYFNAKSLFYRRQRMSLWHVYIKSYVRILMSKIEIMQSSKTLQETQRVNGISDKIIEVNKNMALWVHACYRSAEASVIWLKLAILFYVGMGVFEGTFSLAFFVGLFGVMTLMEASIVGTVKFYRNFTKDFTKIEDLWNFFDSTPDIQGYDSGDEFSYKKGDIKGKNISYSYDEKKSVFDNFSLDILGGKVTALVGPSGGGKTTLVKLIAGYVQCDSGDMLIDSQKLSEISLKSYYKDVGYLTQEPSVFDGTIRENLMYGINTPPHPTSPYSGEEQAAVSSSLNKGGIEVGGEFNKYLDDIIKKAHCEFIYDLPNGINTEIGERGVKLSGGQKQRLAIAKIFLKNPRIIILDEPTSALDSLSEQKITQAMHNLFTGRTVIIIAHRLQTVKHADDIIVIDDGKIIERGTHSSLIRKKGYYKQMLDLQSGF